MEKSFSASSNSALVGSTTRCNLSPAILRTIVQLSAILKDEITFRREPKGGILAGKSISGNQDVGSTADRRKLIKSTVRHQSNDAMPPTMNVYIVMGDMSNYVRSAISVQIPDNLKWRAPVTFPYLDQIHFAQARHHCKQLSGSQGTLVI
jgi:hypothetical protein